MWPLAVDGRPNVCELRFVYLKEPKIGCGLIETCSPSWVSVQFVPVYCTY